jgi:hypothetical protein
MIFTVSNIKKVVLGLLCLTTFESASAFRYGKELIDSEPFYGYGDSPKFGAYYLSPMPIASPPPAQNKSDKNNNLALGLGLGLGLGIPFVASVGAWSYYKFCK